MKMEHFEEEDVIKGVTIKEEKHDFDVVEVKNEAWNDYEGSSDAQENHEFDGVEEEVVEMKIGEEIVVWNDFDESSNDRKANVDVGLQENRNHPRHYCCVLMCKNTTKNSNKLFFTVPLDKKRRQLWMKAIRRDYNDLSPKSNFYICQDHFNLEEDMENYIQWKYTPGMKRKILKKGIVPHIFHCQPDRDKSVEIRPSSINRKRKRETEEALKTVLPSSPEETNHRRKLHLLH